MSKAFARYFGSRFLGSVIALSGASALVACGGGGSDTTATPSASVPTVTAQSVTVKLVDASGSAGSGITPPNPVPRDAAPVNSFTITGSPGAVTAITSATSCDGSPFAVAPQVTHVASGGSVSLAHSGSLFPAGGECSYTLKVSGSTSNADGSLPSDTKAYSFVVDSAAADRVIVLSSTQNHAPVVYVRQDNGSFTLHLPKKDVDWVPGNCLVQRVATSMQVRAVACQKIGVVDAKFYVLALSAADWTLSQDQAQIAKLGTTPAVTNLTYWAGVNEMLSNATPQINSVEQSKNGVFTMDDFGTVAFRPTIGEATQVATKVGSIKLFIGW